MDSRVAPRNTFDRLTPSEDTLRPGRNSGSAARKRNPDHDSQSRNTWWEHSLLVSGFAQPAGATGIPAGPQPLSDPSLIHCAQNSGASPPPVATSFGLAANSIGRYQIGLRLPEGKFDRVLELVCSQSTPSISAPVYVLMKE